MVWVRTGLGWYRPITYYCSVSPPGKPEAIIVNIPSCLPGNHNKEGKMAVPNYFVSDFFTEGWCEPRARIGKVVIEM